MGKKKKSKKDPYSEVVCVIDRSGSMQVVRDDAIGGFNQFLEDQQKLKGKVNISVTLFNTEVDFPYRSVKASKVEPLDVTSYVPSGCTALLDAVGKTINELDARIGKLDKKDKPDSIVLCIITDGLENSSKEFKKSVIKDMVEKHEKEGWNIVFLGANMDAFSEAGQIGIGVRMSAGVAEGSVGMRSAFAAVSNLTGVAHAEGGNIGMSVSSYYNQAEKKVSKK